MSSYRLSELGLEVLPFTKEMWLPKTEDLKVVHIQIVSTVPVNLYGYWSKPYLFFCEDSSDTKYYRVEIPQRNQR